jgi:hypothetical protein
MGGNIRISNPTRPPTISINQSPVKSLPSLSRLGIISSHQCPRGLEAVARERHKSEIPYAEYANESLPVYASKRNRSRTMVD